MVNNGAVVVCLVMVMTLLSLPTADAYPGGPPVSTVSSLCMDMTPQHGGSSQTTTPPYTITMSPTCYTPGEAVTVTLAANSGTNFKGFFLQARKPNMNTMSYGTFSLTGDSLAQTFDCFDRTDVHNAVGHNSSVDKDSISFEWTPPTDVRADIEFVATVVQVQATYWVAAVKNTTQPCSSVTTEAADSPTTTPDDGAGLVVVNSLLLPGMLLLLLIVKLVVSRD